MAIHTCIIAHHSLDMSSPSILAEQLSNIYEANIKCICHNKNYLYEQPFTIDVRATKTYCLSIGAWGDEISAFDNQPLDYEFYLNDDYDTFSQQIFQDYFHTHFAFSGKYGNFLYNLLDYVDKAIINNKKSEEHLCSLNERKEIYKEVARYGGKGALYFHDYDNRAATNFCNFITDDYKLSFDQIVEQIKHESKGKLFVMPNDFQKIPKNIGKLLNTEDATPLWEFYDRFSAFYDTFEDI